MNHAHNEEIDYLRAYAIAFVFILHTLLIFKKELMDVIEDIHGLNLSVGVDLFFVISGYVVSSSYARLDQKTYSLRELYNVFLFNRLYRLWPTAIFWLSICLCLTIYFPLLNLLPNLSDMIYKFSAGLFYIFNITESMSPSVFGYFWSLSLEWQFYCFLPFLMNRTLPKRLIIIFTLLTLNLFYRFGGENWWMFRSDGILIGILIWNFQHIFVTSMTNINAYLKKFFTLLLLILLILIKSLVVNDYLGVALEALISGILVSLAISGPNSIITFGIPSFLKWVGLRSYSIYLSHIPVAVLILGLDQTVNLGLDWYALCFICLLLTVLFSEISYQFLEQRTQQWLKMKRNGLPTLAPSLT